MVSGNGNAQKWRCYGYHPPGEKRKYVDTGKSCPPAAIMPKRLEDKQTFIQSIGKQHVYGIFAEYFVGELFKQFGQFRFQHRLDFVGYRFPIVVQKQIHGFP